MHHVITLVYIILIANGYLKYLKIYVQCLFINYELSWFDFFVPYGLKTKIIFL